MQAQIALPDCDRGKGTPAVASEEDAPERSWKSFEKSMEELLCENAAWQSIMGLCGHHPRRKGYE